jgi:hypothetical protein
VLTGPAPSVDDLSSASNLFDLRALLTDTAVRRLPWLPWLPSLDRATLAEAGRGLLLGEGG